jgi:hypothetical protein
MDRMLATDQEIAEAATPNMRGASAGAASVEPPSLEGNTIAGRAAGAVAKSTKKLNPLLRLLQSPSAFARDVAVKMFENPLYMKKNFSNVASEQAVETFMKEWNGGLVQALKMTNRAYSDYRKGGGNLTRTQFRDAVGKAMRRGDDADDPHVAKVAKEWRAKVFDPLKEAAIKAKVLPEDVTVETAASYLSRMWNRDKLVQQEGRFKAIVTAWVRQSAPGWKREFDQETLAKSAKLEGDKLKEYLIERRIEREARFDDLDGASRAIADDVFNTLTGKRTDAVRPEFVKVSVRGPLKERTFNIQDELVEEFLESDVELIGRRYTRIMGADVELSQKFGSVDMAEQIQKIRDDYAALRAAAPDEKARAKLDAAERTDVSDIEGLRDLLRGTRNEGQVERNYRRIVRGFNSFNYIRLMGEVVAASLTDVVRPAMVHGLKQFMETVPQLVTNVKGIKMAVAEAQLAGNVSEVALGHRMASITDIMDPYSPRHPMEAFLENMTNLSSKWNGIRMWTDWMQGVASVMTQNRILKNVADFASINPKERAYLNYLGIDQSMAERIAAQFSAHGEDVDGVKVAHTDNWTDPVVVRAYRAAMNKDVDSIIVMKGVADTPLFASTPTGQALLQFKSFALASHQRVLLRGLQEDQTRFLGGAIALTTMGMFITYLKAQLGNREEKLTNIFDNPGQWIGNGADRAGLFAVPFEISNTIEKAFGMNPITSPLKMWDETGSMGQKVASRNEVGALLGPTVGLGQDIMSASGAVRKWKDGDEATQGQVNAMERILPWHTYIGLRQMLRYAINTPD